MSEEKWRPFNCFFSPETGGIRKFTVSWNFLKWATKSFNSFLLQNSQQQLASTLVTAIHL
jgi:hypothetical protein